MMPEDAEEDCPEERQAATGDFCLTREQAEALAFDHNVAITAGAGTGKTAVLTERYLRILEANPEIGPEEIVTITFTNDAANELQDRIRDAVGARLEDADPDTYDRWRTVKDDLDDGYIHTIHGFCSRILREHVVDANVTPEFEVYDETDAVALAKEVIRDELDDRLAADDRDVRRLAHLWNRGKLEEILSGLLQLRPKSDEWASYWQDKTPEEYIDYLWETVHPISPAFAEGVFAKHDVLAAFETISLLKEDGLLEDVLPADDDGAHTIATVSQLLVEHEPLQDGASVRARQRFLDELCEYLTTADGTRNGNDWWYWGSRNRWDKAGRESEQERLKVAVEALFDAIDPESLEFGVEADRASSHYVLALARLYSDIREAYESEKDQQNALDYNDLIERTIGFLEDSSGVRQRLREQFQFVMVDEVQDTDPRQMELVKLLTSTEPNAFDAQNVFLVGDEKQSIYRFRGADVTSFAEARRDLATANPNGIETNRELSGNFRTTEETLQFCNGLFDADGVFDAFGDEYEPFEAHPQPLTAERDEGQNVEGQCEYLLVPDDDFEDLHAPGYLDAMPRFTESGEREAYAVAARLTQLLADPPQVYDEDAGETREATPEDITILFRSRGRLKSFERALDEFDVPYAVVSGSGYYDSPEISALLNLLRVLERPQDQIALYGVLRSPLFGFTDEELAKLRVVDGGLWEALQSTEQTLSEAIADAEIAADFADAYDTLQRWRRRAGTHPNITAESTTPWGTLLSAIIDETGFLASVAGDERPRQAAVNVNKFREQVRRWEEGGSKSISELRSRLERRQDIESHSGEATIPEEADGVQIRTIHSAKGLEFPIVVVPELGVRFNFGADVDDYGTVYFDELDLQGDGTREPVIGLKSPTPDDAFAEEDTLARRIVKNGVRQHDRAELKRLLYVATTRARDHLLLSGVHKIEEEDEYRLAEPNDPAEAMCWRDWLQPILLGEDHLERLSRSEVLNESLAESQYDVRRPVPPVEDWQSGEDREGASLAIDIPSPAQQDPAKVLTATEFASMQTGDREVYLEDQNEDAGPREFEGFSPRNLGTVVHRICETRLDPSDWEQFTRNVGQREGQPPTGDDFDRVMTYASRALDFLEEYETVRDVSKSYDELSVVARFDGARIVGDIDHLSISSDTYHIVDYKTNDTSKRTVDELAGYYWPQLEAYAVALHQNEPERAVELTLYFTDAAEVRFRSFDPGELDELEDSIRSELESL